MATLLISSAIRIGVGILLLLLFPKKGQDTTQEGPRLSDLSVSSSAFGESIPIHYGTVRTKGNIIWSSGLKETVNTDVQQTGGKGFGGGATATTITYTYSADFAIAFAEGVADTVLKVWADGKLIYDATTGDGGIGTAPFRFYPGNETQQPDALIEADKGTGQVPAHRGLCYMVFENLQLANYGNRVPNITAEITFNKQASAPFDGIGEFSGSNNIAGSSTGTDAGYYVVDPFSDRAFSIKDAADGILPISLSADEVVNEGGFTSLEWRAITLAANGYIYGQPGSGNSEPIRKLDPISLAQLAETSEDGTGFGRTYLGVLQKGFPAAGVEPVTLLIAPGDITFTTVGTEGLRVWQDTGDTLTNIDLNPGNASPGEIDDTSVDISYGGPVIEDPWNNKAWFLEEDSSQVDIYTIDFTINYDPLFGGGVKIDTVTYSVIATLTKGGTDYAGTGATEGWCYLPEEEAVILSDGGSMVKVDLSDGSVLARNLTLGFYTHKGWTNNGKFAFVRGSDDRFIDVIDTDDLTVLSSLTIGDVDFGDGGGTDMYPRSAYDPRTHSIIGSRLSGSPATGQRLVQLYLDRAQGSGVSVQSVVEDLCDRAGLDSSEYDASALSALTVWGFSVSKQSTVRSALEPLGQAFFFEGVESDWKMKFVERGGSSADTLSTDYVGELTTSPEDTPIKENRVQEVELPERVTVRYGDVDLDYEQGAQHKKRIFAPTPTMRSQEEVVIDLPVVGFGDGMKQLAEKILYTVWAERVNYEWRAPWRYLLLDPTDIATLENYKGADRRLRFSSVEVGADLSLSMGATQEDARAHVSGASADIGDGQIPQLVPGVYPSRFLPLDLPLLTSGDASYQAFSRGYWAAAGYEDSWPGCFLYRSQDEGTTYNQIGGQNIESAWGVIDGTLADAVTTYTWDDDNTIDLKVYRGIDLFQSSTDLEVLNGDNAIAVIGSAGPEIIQFVNVTQIDAGTVRLSRLLRGRRGTEPNAKDRNPSETWVMLGSTRTLGLQVPLNLIGESLPYRVVTLGKTLEDAQTQFVTYNGEDLKPYSPVEVEAVTDGGGDVDITWVRRTRFNGELMDYTGDVPLNEESESYDIEIYDNATSNLLRTLTATSESVTYTAAQQSTDGSPATIDIVVYQNSGLAQIDRGRPSDTFTHTI